MKVPQFSPWVGKEEYDSIKSCFDNNWITEGPKTSEFKDQLLKLTGAKFGVFTPNGTLAIYLGLKAMGVGSGDEVLVPDFTFIGTATAVEMAGARPVFVEVNRRNFQIDTEKASVALTKKTRAIIPVHIYGTAVNMTAVCPPNVIYIPVMTAITIMAPMSVMGNVMPKTVNTSGNMGITALPNVRKPIPM